MRHSERPISAVCRSLAAAAWAMLSSRATLEAKQHTAMRPLYWSKISVSAIRTSASDPVLPGSKTLVESPIKARTPSSPTARSASKSVGSPTNGVGSNFQSPVCTTVPAPHRSTTALGSGIEWVWLISWISNGPTTKLAPSATSRRSTSPSRPASSSLRRTRDAVNGVQ